MPFILLVCSPPGLWVRPVDVLGVFDLSIDAPKSRVSCLARREGAAKPLHSAEISRTLVQLLPIRLVRVSNGGARSWGIEINVKRRESFWTSRGPSQEGKWVPTSLGQQRSQRHIRIIARIKSRMLQDRIS